MQVRAYFQVYFSVSSFSELMEHRDVLNSEIRYRGLVYSFLSVSSQRDLSDGPRTLSSLLVLRTTCSACPGSSGRCCCFSTFPVCSFSFSSAVDSNKSREVKEGSESGPYNLKSKRHTHLSPVKFFVPFVNHSVKPGVAGVFESISADGRDLPFPTED